MSWIQLKLKMEYIGKGWIFKITGSFDLDHAVFHHFMIYPV